MAYQKSIAVESAPVNLPDGTRLKLACGKHGELQAGVIEDFTSHFAPCAHLLYASGTESKRPYRNAGQLSQLNLSLTKHDELPDVVLYDQTREWLFLIEAITSGRLMTPKRVAELEKMFVASSKGCIYVSAFFDLEELGQHAEQIAWDTEAWIAQVPEHLIHFNGDRFLGPR